jgi:hypothetical protein
MKNLARRGLRPLVRPLKRLAGPVIARLHFRVVHWTHETTDARFENLERLVTSTRADVDGLERYMPAVLGAIQSQNARNRANVRTEEELARLVQSVLERFQSVRNELVSGRDGGGIDTVGEPKILRRERVDAAAGDLRLNLGSGREARPGYINVDAQAFDSVDVLADPRDLPFDQRSVAEIRAAHLLERFSVREIERAILPHWVSLLTGGGSLAVTVPDADAMVRSYVAGDLSFEALREATFGDRTHDGPVRFTMFSPESLCELFTDAGLHEVVVVRNADRETPYEIEVVGHTPATPPSS